MPPAAATRAVARNVALVESLGATALDYTKGDPLEAASFTFRFVAGVFWQEQKNDIEERYFIDGIGSAIEVPGWEDTIWLTKQDRIDRDKAVFGEVVGISLLATCTFRLRRQRGASWERVNLTARPRSAYLLSGPARTEWEHSIPPVDALRYSITFRNLRATDRV